MGKLETKSAGLEQFENSHNFFFFFEKAEFSSITNSVNVKKFSGAEGRVADKCVLRILLGLDSFTRLKRTCLRYRLYAGYSHSRIKQCDLCLML